MKRFLLALGLASLAIALALVAGSLLTGRALPVVLGVLAGVAASLPTSLIMEWGVTRARNVPGPAPQARPPTVIVVPPAPPAPEQPTAAAAPASTAGPLPGLVHETRPYTLIGGRDEAEA
jgi:hypothetical protein